jgi:hypothetical protein
MKGIKTWILDIFKYLIEFEDIHVYFYRHIVPFQMLTYI